MTKGGTFFSDSTGNLESQTPSFDTQNFNKITNRIQRGGL
jgi:hypothetical protein